MVLSQGVEPPSGVNEIAVVASELTECHTAHMHRHTNWTAIVTLRELVVTHVQLPKSECWLHCPRTVSQTEY